MESAILSKSTEELPTAPSSIEYPDEKKENLEVSELVAEEGIEYPTEEELKVLPRIVSDLFNLVPIVLMNQSVRSNSLASLFGCVH